MMNIGVLSPAEIAYRRFLPALKENKNFNYIGLAIYDEQERFGGSIVSRQEKTETMDKEHAKGKRFVDTYGGKLFYSYTDLLLSSEIDAVYIPLPPALHDKWAELALRNGKHVLVEKPSTISYEKTRRLTLMAEKDGLALHENYMFLYHGQIAKIQELLKKGVIGDVRLFSMRFGFPRRSLGDFRYDRMLGGGALLDAGGYVLNLASLMLGGKASVKCASLNYLDEFDVDMFGSATLENETGTVAQVAFGMDNGYKCEMEIWGSKGSLSTERIFTAPADFLTSAVVKTAQGEEKLILGMDHTFTKSIDQFYQCITNEKIRRQRYLEIENQAKLVEEAALLARNHKR